MRLTDNQEFAEPKGLRWFALNAPVKHDDFNESRLFTALVF